MVLNMLYKLSKGKGKHYLKPSLIFNSYLTVRYTSTIVSQSCGNNQPISDWIHGPIQEMEQISDTALLIKNLRLDGLGPREKIKYYCSVKET